MWARLHVAATRFEYPRAVVAIRSCARLPLPHLVAKVNGSRQQWLQAVVTDAAVVAPSAIVNGSRQQCHAIAAVADAAAVAAAAAAAGSGFSRQ